MEKSLKKLLWKGYMRDHFNWKRQNYDESKKICASQGLGIREAWISREQKIFRVEKDTVYYKDIYLHVIIHFVQIHRIYNIYESKS